MGRLSHVAPHCAPHFYILHSLLVRETVGTVKPVVKREAIGVPFMWQDSEEDSEEDENARYFSAGSSLSRFVRVKRVVQFDDSQPSYPLEKDYRFPPPSPLSDAELSALEIATHEPTGSSAADSVEVCTEGAMKKLPEAGRGISGDRAIAVDSVAIAATITSDPTLPDGGPNNFLAAGLSMLHAVWGDGAALDPMITKKTEQPAVAGRRIVGMDDQPAENKSRRPLWKTGREAKSGCQILLVLSNRCLFWNRC